MLDPSKFNLRHLRALCAVAECDSISAASNDVFLSQPAITQAIAKLERMLEATLFTRKHSGTFLTEPGALFRNRAKRALAHISDGAYRAAKTARNAGSKGFSKFDWLLTSAQLRALLAVAETGNFSWAARKIGVSQPTVHKASRDLERLSGMVLFDRTPHGIKLTPSAEILARQARLAFSELEQGLAEVNAWSGHDTAQITIGTLPLIRSRILPKAINELARLRPDVQVRVLDGAYEGLLRALRHGQLDLLVGALRDPLPVDDVVQTELFTDQLAIVARTDHPLADRDALSVCDLSNYPWVVPRPGIPTREHFDALFREAGLASPTRLVESSSLVLTRELLLGSDRLTIISAHQVRHEIGRGLLRYLDVALDRAARPIGMTVRSDWQPTATQSLFVHLLRQASREAGSNDYSKTE